MPEKARARLDRLIEERGENYAKVSQALGKNAAYIQQYIKRGVPTALSAVDQDRLAQYFGVPRDFLRQTDGERLADECLMAIGHVQKAISLAEIAGLDLAECHLQIGLDLLQQHQISGLHGVAQRSDFESN